MDRRIAIIGAGPAGLTAALELKKRGFHDLTIFGKFSEAQLKTMQVDGIAFDVAACLLHFGYHSTVIPLVRKTGLTVNYIDTPADIVDRRLRPIKKSSSQVVEIYLNILYYLFFFVGWLLLHRTRWQKAYSSSMEAFLKRRGLSTLAESFAMGPGGIAQGYGFLDEVTAYHGMRWFRPRLFLTPLLSKYKLGVATISEGYETLFKEIIDQFHCKEEIIKSVRPSLGKVELIDEQENRLVFDEVIIACPLDRIQFPHRYLFNEESINESHIFSYLFTSAIVPPFADRAYLDEYIRTKQKNKALVIRTGGRTNSGDYLYWAVGYKTKDITKEELQDKIEDQLIEECGLPVKRLHFFEFFRYNLRFSSSAVRRGLPQQLESLQGHQKIWYSGGLASHWDISSIYEHNRRLINKLHFRNQPKTLFSALNYLIHALLSWLRLL